MEDQLWSGLYPLIQEEDKRRPRLKRVQFSDAAILAVAAWAILHDRPICWACRRCNWPGRPESFTRDLPSPATMSRRLRRLSLWLLLEQVFSRLLAVSGTSASCLCRRVDSKPLPVGGFSKDRDARRGYASCGTCKGYKLFGCWAKNAPVPEAVVLGPMNESDPAGTAHLIDRVGQLHPGPLGAGGYVLADSTDDTNALHEYLGQRGYQLLTPRRLSSQGKAVADHHRTSPYRLRSIELLEGPGGLGGPGTFGRSLYRLREQVERDYGNLGSFGAGLQPLPQFVRRPRRVAMWVIIKLLLNGIRICQKTGVTP